MVPKYPHIFSLKYKIMSDSPRVKQVKLTTFTHIKTNDISDLNPNLLYNLPPEIHSHIFSNFKLSQSRSFLFANKKMNNILSNNYIFWQQKYNEIFSDKGSENLADDDIEENKNTILIFSIDKCIDKLRKYFMNKYFVKMKLDEVVTNVTTDQRDITQLIRHKDLLFVSSDDCTVKIYRNYRLENVFNEHKGGVWTIDLKLDDNKDKVKYLVCGSTDKTVRIYDVEEKRTLHLLTGHRSTVRCLKVADDNIITGSRDSDVRVWNFDGELLYVLKGHSMSVRCMSVHKNFLVTGSYDGTVILWDYKTGKKIFNLKQHSLRVYSVLVTEDFVISGSQDNFIYVSSIKTGEMVFLLKEHRNIVAWLKYVKNGKNRYLFSSGADGIVIKWDLNVGKPIYKIMESGHVTSMKIWNDLMVVARNDSVNLYNAKNGRIIRSLTRNTHLVYDVAFKNNSIVIAYKGDSSTKLLMFDYRKL